MAKQKYNIGVDSLSYAKSETPYVAPPTKEILAFRRQRENEYLTTRNNINLAEEFKKTVPSNPVSQAVYDNMVNKIDSTLSGITPDNYADKTLDTNQLIHDSVYKFGGKELADQQNDYQAKAKAIAETKDVRPEKLEWKARQLQANLQPITEDDKGNFIVPGLTTPKVVKDKDLFKSAADLVKDFKSSANYVHNANGSISIDKGVAGRYGITKTEFADEKELYNTALTYLSKDSANAEYIDDEAEFALYKNPPTPESLAYSMSDIAVSTFFPDKVEKDANGKVIKVNPVTQEDIAKITKGNPMAFRQLAKENEKFNQMNAVSQSIANIYGFSKEDKTFFEDQDYAEAAKARYTKATGGNDIGGDEPTSPLVIVKPATTFTVANPVIYDNYKADEEKNIVEYVEAKKNYTDLVQQIDKDKTQEPRLREVVAEAKEKLERADANIQYTRQAQENLTKSIVQIAKGKANLDIEKEFEATSPVIRADIKNTNATTLVNTGYSVDVTDLVTDVSSNGKEGKIGTETLPIYTKAEADSKKGQLSSFILKDGTTYKAVIADSRRSGTHGMITTKTILKNRNPSMFSNNVYSAGSKPVNRTNIQSYPKTDDFNKLVAKLFTNPDSSTVGESPVAVAKAKELANKMKKEVKVSDVSVNQTLDYLYVDDQVKKGTAAYDLLRLGVSIDTTLQADANQYKVVNDSGQWEDLPLYLRSKGLSVNDIDFSKLKTSVMLTSDREYGQKLNMPLPLTEDGKKILARKDPDALSLSGTLNVTAVAATGKNSGFNKKLVDTVYRAYKESFNNSLPSGDQERKAYGLVAFDNSPYSEDFYKLNLYTMADGATATYTTPDNNKLTINAIKRSATPGRLGDNDFYLTNPNGGIMATDRQTGVTAFVPKSSYDADTKGTKYKRTMFASPEDIGSLIGQNFMNLQAKNSNSNIIKNQQVKTSGSSYEIGVERIRSTEYESTTTTTRKTYGTSAAPRIIKDGTGKEVSINSRINPKEMTYLKDEFPDNFKDGVYPYMNNSVVNAATSLIKDYKLHITDMFRPAGNSARLKGGAKNSLHEYGKSFDARYNEEAQKLLADLTANPEIAQNLGVSYAFKHIINGVPHLHIDFN